MEIERKFLVDPSFQPERFNPEKFKIAQGYISLKPITRIRVQNKEYFLTQKEEGTIARNEIETKIDKKTFIMLSKLTTGRVIYKTRYKIKLENYTVELDYFHHNLEGLRIAEIEFKSLEDAMNFEAPSWFLEEVTYDRRYQNINLAMNDPDELRLILKRK